MRAIAWGGLRLQFLAWKTPQNLARKVIFVIHILFVAMCSLASLDEPILQRLAHMRRRHLLGPSQVGNRP
jgi:hypothetical protein